MTNTSGKTKKGQARRREAMLRQKKGKVVPVLRSTGIDLGAAVGGAVAGALLPGWAGGIGGLGLLIAANAMGSPAGDWKTSAMRTAGATMLTSVSVSAIGGGIQRKDGQPPGIMDKAKAQALTIIEKFRLDRLLKKKDAPAEGDATSLGYAGNPSLAALDAVNRQLEASAFDFRQSGAQAVNPGFDASY